MPRRQVTIPTDKGRTTIVALPTRVIETLRDYLDERAKSDKATGRPLAHLPLFCGHRSNQKDQCTALTSHAVRHLISTRAAEALGTDKEKAIRPSSFKHERITPLFDSITLLHALVVNRSEAHFRSGNYADAVFGAMRLIEEEVRTRIGADPTDLGLKLISRAMKANPPDTPLIVISKVPAEQDAAHALFAGAIGAFKNPHSHRFVEITNPFEAFECLAFASLLLRMLDEAEYQARPGSTAVVGSASTR